MKPRVCTRCGCTDDHACPGGCWWMPAPLKDVCSACATTAELVELRTKAIAMIATIRRRAAAKAAGVHRHLRQGGPPSAN